MTRDRADLLAQLLTELEQEQIPPGWRKEIAAVKDIVWAVQTVADIGAHSRKVPERRLRRVM